MKSRVLGLVIALLLLGLGAIVATRWIHPSNPKEGIPGSDVSASVTAQKNPPPAPGPSPETATKLQAAIKAQLTHQDDEADKLFREALAADPRLKGVVYQRAVVAFNRHDFTAAISLANDSIAKKEEVSASYVLLGTMCGLQDDNNGALAAFLKAAEASPADPLPLYNASESLRHLGRPAEAIEKLRDAIQRNPGEPLYAFKLRLARIEAGQQHDLEADIRQQLALKPPAGDWVLTAAAVSLKNGRVTEAAGLMSAARQVMQPALFFSLIQDSLFKRFEKFSEIAPFYDVKISSTPPKPSP